MEKIKNTQKSNKHILLSKGILLLILFTTIGIGISVRSFSQKTSVPTQQLNVIEVCTNQWNTPNGIPYAQSPGYNLGVMSFAVLDNNTVAYLNSVTSEILIVNCKTGQVTSKFPVSFAPQDFVYDNGRFYVLSEYLLSIYSYSGQKITDIPYSKDFIGVEHIERANNETYLQLPDGSSIAIEADGTPMQGERKLGWVSSDGTKAYPLITGPNSYSIEYTNSNGSIMDQKFTSDMKIAGIYFIGASNGVVWIDLQTYITEVPISVNRSIVGIDFTSRSAPFIANSLKLPNIYYVLTNRDLLVTQQGVFDLLTAEDGVHLFLINELNNKSANATGFPLSLLNHNYHYNDHLIQVDSK